MRKDKIEQIADYVGKKFGYLTILKELDRDKNGRHVLVKCDCGETKECRWSHIKYGKIKSCGCYNAKLMSERQKTHGLSNHNLYDIRRGIIDRCYNENIDNYKKYGEEGVTVCQEWLDSFEVFYNWAIANGWEIGLQIDKDIKWKEKYGVLPGKIYSPEFCQFVTHKTNARNTRTNVFIEYKGETKTIAEWCEIVGISQKRFCSRRKRGWSTKENLSTPLLNNNKKRKHVNKSQN